MIISCPRCKDTPIAIDFASYVDLAEHLIWHELPHRPSVSFRQYLYINKWFDLFPIINKQRPPTRAEDLVITQVWEDWKQFNSNTCQNVKCFECRLKDKNRQLLYAKYHADITEARKNRIRKTQ